MPEFVETAAAVEEAVEDFFAGPHSNLPEIFHPVGYHLLVWVPRLDEFIGAMVMPEGTRSLEDLAQLTGQVVAMGPDAYGDEKKFPSGKYCKIGDWVVFRAYAGTHLKIGSECYRLINDDTVLAVTARPATVKRA